ncbi:MAG: SGNH/GDSL hydrolase family protein [Acidimicrobiia bacterium]|nr:SGNH/GDSL hydrolase family protein [Acidimicrobiia bacterium]
MHFKPYFRRRPGVRFPAASNLRINVLLALAVLGSVGCAVTPAAPTVGSTIAYAAVGASDVTGVGSSAPCVPYADCLDGRGYVFVAARTLRAQGYTVNVTNLGIPTGVISRSYQDLGTQLGRTILGNFIDQEAPFVPRDATLITVFAGANETNLITSALGAGMGGHDPAAYVDQQVVSFGNDFKRLLSALRSQAPGARLVLLNVPNVAGMPFLSGGPAGQRQAAQRASVRMTTDVINPLAGPGVDVIDLMCEARLYDRGHYSNDGFHPNDAGYAVIGEMVARAATSTSHPAPARSCAQMNQV